MFIIAILAFPGLSGHVSVMATESPLPIAAAGALTSADWADLGPMTSIPYSERSLSIVPGSIELGAAPSTPLHVLITLQYTNSAELSQFLTALSNPSSPEYHQYLSAAGFDAAFSPSTSTYDLLLSYLRSEGATSVTTFTDRDTVGFDATPSALSAMFGVTEMAYQVGPISYVAPVGTPELPSDLSPYIANVEGLSTSPLLQAHTASGGETVESVSASKSSPLLAGGYLAPPTVSGVQYEYASDFQVGYDESSLLQEYSYPTTAVVATILWAGEYTGTPQTTANGTLTTNEYLGPFVPSNIYEFYNTTLPPSEPKPTIQAVPVGGAPRPSGLASWDTTGATFENTLDLEMVGSLAPGAHIYNVYSNTSSYADLDQDFASVLNPAGLGAPGLANVSVISNSWYGDDTNDSSWYADLQQAQARGITVLACTGDSGNDYKSSKFFGSNASYPSSESFNDFGSTGVGGSDNTLSATTLQVNGLKTWYIAPNDVSDGGPAGTEGGISSIFPEPSWQKTYVSSSILTGGRGLPDISAQANNTLVTWSSDGHAYLATNASKGDQFEYAWGTSIATPMIAGIIAMVDHVLNASDEPWMGYLNPDLYNLSSREDTAPTTSGNTGYYEEGGFDSELPTNPLLNVTKGSNYLYSARLGWSFVTGWGNLDAYNFTMYYLQAHSEGVVGRFSAVEDYLNLTGLSVTTPANPDYDASIQQNLFLANSLGAPVYWIQNVIYFTAAGTNKWTVDDTGWIIYPFFGLYPYQASYEYNFPASTTFTTPSSTDIYTSLVTGSGFNTQRIDFNVGAAHLVTLAVPGGAYIIGNATQSYNWKGVTYWNGPFPNNTLPGGLSPQFDFVGGPSGGNGTFATPTAGTLTAFVRPWGLTGWTPAQTGIVGPSNTETGETAYDIEYTATASPDTRDVGVLSGSGEQGVFSYQGTGYNVVATETGLPAGATWWVNLTNGLTFSSRSSSFTFQEVNGTYPYTVSTNAAGYSAAGGSFTVAGASTTLTATFTHTTYTVTFATIPTTCTITFNGISYPNAGSVSGLSAGTYSLAANACSGESFSTWSSTAGTVASPTTSPTTITVSANGTVTATYTTAGTTYTVTFATSPTTCTVTFSGTSYSNGGSVSGVASGTYPLVANACAGETFTSWSSTAGTVTSATSASTTVDVTATGTITATYTATASTYTLTFITSPTFCTVTFNGVSYVDGATDAGVAAGSYTLLANTCTGEAFVSWSSTAGAVTSTTSASTTITVSATGTVTATYTTASTTYDVTFVTNPTSCSVAFNGATYTSGTSVTGVAPGSYSLVAKGCAGETFSDWASSAGAIASPTSASTTITVSASGTVTADYQATTYPVTFTESGLPAGTSWSVTLGGQTLSSTTTTIVFSEVNSTYTFTVGTVSGYSAAPASGSLPVSGATSQDIVFTALPPPTYNVTFTETGLTSGTSWGVTLAGTTKHATTTSIVFSEVNGTVAFTILAVSGYSASPSSGSITVAGGPVDKSIAFTPLPPPMFAVTFAETGLPTGTSWSVTVGSTPSTSTSSTIVFQEANGTYSYTVAAVSGFSVTKASGQVIVEGEATGITVSFTSTVQPTYAVTVTETGLPDGATWWLNLTTGTSYSSNGTTLDFLVANGSYSYSVTSAASGYTAPDGSFLISGAPTSVAVTFTFTSSSSPPATGTSGILGLPGWDGYLLLLVLLAVIVVVVAVGLSRRPKAQAMPPPPQWQPYPPYGQPPPPGSPPYPPGP